MLADKTLSLQSLPLEVLLKIFEYIPQHDAFELRNECKIFRYATACYFYHSVACLPGLINSLIKSAKDQMFNSPFNSDGSRLQLVKSLLYLNYIQNEVKMFRCIVERYFPHSDNLGSNMFPKMLNVLDEFMRNLETIKDNPNRIDLFNLTQRAHLAKWENFLVVFDINYEPHIDGDQTKIEILLMEIVLCSPWANIFVDLKGNPENGYTLVFNSSLVDAISRQILHFLSFYKSLSRKEILHTIRSCIRSCNSSHINSIYRDIFDMESKLFTPFLEINLRDNYIEGLKYKYDLLRKDILYPPVKHIARFEGDEKHYQFSRVNLIGPYSNGVVCNVVIENLKESDIESIRDLIKEEDLGSLEIADDDAFIPGKRNRSDSLYICMNYFFGSGSEHCSTQIVRSSETEIFSISSVLITTLPSDEDD